MFQAPRPILAATGAFLNSSGSGAVVANSGRWLVYSATSAGDTFGNLNSANAAVWNTAPNAAVVPTGNRYVFANQPTATFTSVSLGKAYGVNDTAAVAASYTVSALQSVANAYADTSGTVTTGTASVTSAGSVATATVAGSPYAITAATGTLVSTNGYALAYASPGLLTLTAVAATITAIAQTKVYGAANPTLTYSTSGFVNGDVPTGALATVATAASTVAASPYAITQGTLDNPNYTITYVGANLTVTAATLTVGLTGSVSKVYNNTLTATLVAGNYSLTGIQNSDVITVTNTAGTYDTVNVGTGKTVTVTSLVISGANASSYVLASTLPADRGRGRHHRRAADLYGECGQPGLWRANPALSGTTTGYQGSDTQANSTTGTLAFTTLATTGSNVGSYLITGSGPHRQQRQLQLRPGGRQCDRADHHPGGRDGHRREGLYRHDRLRGRPAFGHRRGQWRDPVADREYGTAASANVGSASGTLAGLALSVSGGNALASNYLLPTTGVLTITPAQLTYVANAASRAHGAANPALSAEQSPVFGDRQSGECDQRNPGV